MTPEGSVDDPLMEHPRADNPGSEPGQDNPCLGRNLFVPVRAGDPESVQSHDNPHRGRYRLIFVRAESSEPEPIRGRAGRVRVLGPRPSIPPVA